MSNNFRVGMKVVCVDAEPLPGFPDWGPGSRPQRGRVYTVREIRFGYPYAGIKLCELWNYVVQRNEPDDFYMGHRFRPAVDKPASIEVFKRMLLPSDEKVGA